MKRMSDVFELPLAVEENQGEPLLSDAPCYFESFDEDGKGSERAKHAAHAINHVDALADALADLMRWHVENVNVIHHPVYDCAHSALAAYRGKA